MSTKKCDLCGMAEDHYGKNTMPLFRVPVGKHDSTTVCEDCVYGGIGQMVAGNLPTDDLKHVPQKYRDHYESLMAAKKSYEDRSR